ncbi:sugar-binding transcriptional regulator [Lacrimispora sp.]|uniref:sugar-binding transcriptional regulator n=1 Tax=Lacrimispora sp. TaxID=2719234 RepID=UPI0028AD38FE|nr:sugar-binding transcriptional regulator [Lacrimispora sp.]
MDMHRRELVAVCQLYYVENKTQQQIAALMGLSRVKVSRLLQKAKDLEIVRIIINYTGTHIELEHKISRKFGLKETIIADNSFGGDSKDLVASAAAFYLNSNLAKGSTVAVGWGTTMCRIPDYLQNLSGQKLLFTPIIGGHGQNELDIHATTIASNMAKKTGCQSLSLLAPALVNTKEEKEVLFNDAQINQVLSKVRTADYALFSLGSPLTPDSSLSKSGYLSDKDFEQLIREKAICDIISIAFLDKGYSGCCANITDRSIGITKEELKRIPLKICVAEGREKHSAIEAALYAGYIDVLIIDQETGHYLIH